MSSIALFPCLPALDSGILDELSSALNFSIYTDENLFEETFTRFGGGKENLKMMMYSKTSVFNQFTLERERIVNMFRLVLADKLSSTEQHIFHGFHTLLIPPQVTEVLRVLTIGKKECRIELAIQSGLPAKDAMNMIETHDQNTANWTEFLFPKDGYKSSLYDLIIPFEDAAPHQISAEILNCLHKTSVLRTAESRKAVQEMKTTAEIERTLLTNGHKTCVRTSDGNVTLSVESSAPNFIELKTELTELVKRLKGVREVTVETTESSADSPYRQKKYEQPSKVLLVDDEQEFVQTVSERLISRDVGTYGVYDGESALELIAVDRPDVMVLDLKMPGLNGLEVLRRAKELAPEIEIIILTSHGTTKDMEECMKLGAFAYINKPVNLEKLSATIKAANQKVHSSPKA